MKQHQVIAIVKDRKEAWSKAITAIYQAFQKPDLFAGVMKTYRPSYEDEPAQSPVSKKPAFTVRGLLASLRRHMVEGFDVVLTQDVGNMKAMGDVIVTDSQGTEVTLLNKVPAAHLLFSKGIQ